jgi:hypothetical protein
MNEERMPETTKAGGEEPSPAGNAVPPELQGILCDLQSPDANTRARAVRALCPCRGIQWGVPVFPYGRKMLHDPNPIVRRAVRHDLNENPWWSERRETRPDFGPHPRTIKVTLAIKGTALGDRCDRWRVDTGLPLVADPRLARHRVTLLCRQMPLRDVLRQLSRLLECPWVWTRSRGTNRYELRRDSPSLVSGEPRRPGRQAAQKRQQHASAATSRPDAACVNARLAHDRALRQRITLQPTAATTSLSSPRNTRLSSADVLEAIHHATGLPIVADFSAQLYPVEDVSACDQSLFAMLNQISTAMELSWHKEADGWLQFRGSRFDPCCHF